MAGFTPRDEIEVALRYIQRVRAMQPSAAALQNLDDQETELKRELKRLDEASATSSSPITLSSDPRRPSSPHRIGFR